MKKTLLFSALFLLVGSPNVLADDMGEASTIDINDVAALGYDAVEWISETSGGTIDDGCRGSYHGFVFNLSTSNTRMMVTADPVGGSRTPVQALTEIKVQFRNNLQDQFQTGDRLVISDDSGKIYGVSSAVSGDLGTASAWLSFSFGSEGIQLVDNNTYHAHFVSSSFDVTHKTLSSSDTVKRGMGLQQYTSSEDAAQLMGVSDDHGEPTNSYAPIVKIQTHNIPEPATATLSLLALAGLATRRRRK